MNDYLCFITDNECLTMIEVFTLERVALSLDEDVVSLSMSIISCNYSFGSLWTIRNFIALFYIEFFGISPYWKLGDLLAFLIIESEFMASWSQCVFYDNFSFSDNGSTKNSITLYLYDELTKFILELREFQLFFNFFKGIRWFYFILFLIFWNKKL